MKSINVANTKLPSATEMMVEIIAAKGLAFVPCKEASLSSFGFAIATPVTDFGNGSGYKLAFTLEKKSISPKALATYHKRLLAEAKDKGEDLNHIRKLELKELALSELCKKAPTELDTIYAYYSEAKELLIIDSSSEEIFSRCLSLLVKLLESLETKTLHVSGVSKSLTKNIKENLEQDKGLGFAGFSFGDKLNLESEDKSKASFNGDYPPDLVLSLINDGYTVKKVSLSKGGLTFDLNEDFRIQNIKTSKFLDDSFLSQSESLLTTEEQKKDPQVLNEERRCRYQEIKEATELHLISSFCTELLEFFKPKMEEPSIQNNQ